MELKSRKLLEEKNKNKYKTSVNRLKSKRRKEIIILFLIIIFGVLTFWFVNSKYVRLNNINVSGTVQINNELLLEKAEINSTKKIWEISETDVENIIKSNFNIVENVRVSTKILDNINIEVTEKRIIAREKDNNNNYVYIMSDGQVFSEKLKEEVTVPIIEDFSEDLSKRESIIKNLLNLKEEVLVQISEIANEKDNESEAIIYMKDGQKVKINSSNFSDKLNYYVEISKHIEDKSNTVLNLVNGAYLETKKTTETKEKKIQEILEKSNNPQSTTKNTNKTNSTEESNVETSNVSSTNATQSSNENTNSN